MWGQIQPGAVCVKRARFALLSRAHLQRAEKVQAQAPWALFPAIELGALCDLFKLSGSHFSISRKSEDQIRFFSQRICDLENSDPLCWRSLCDHSYGIY